MDPWEKEEMDAKENLTLDDGQVLMNDFYFKYVRFAVDVLDRMHRNPNTMYRENINRVVKMCEQIISLSSLAIK